jgi:Fungal Zn(2)-Cys(6) binuclear cluster domain/Fungal specific transcription factor domain
LNSRLRRVKCDGVRPVCDRCEKSNRQCTGPGFSDEVRLILKDETQTVIKRFKRKSRESSEGEGTRAERSSSGSEGSAPPEGDAPSLVNNITLSECNDDCPAEWYPLIPKVQVSPVYERDQVALFCCKKTVNFKTLSWIMSDDKWIGILPDMMGRSEALASVIHANAVNYLARATGANSTPGQALTYYISSLKELQRDLYNPVRQTSDETLFAIILLGVFDVDSFFGRAECLAT